MENTHWSDDDLLDRLYGVGRDNEDHLITCQDCRHRWIDLQESRKASLESPVLPVDLMASQRQAIWNRIERPTVSWWRQPLAPAAMALTLAMAVWLQMPAPSPQPTVAQSIPDSALFEDVFQQVERTAPESLAPVQALFEERQ
jgi:hypothetical protein